MKEPKTPEYIYYKRTNLHEQRKFFKKYYSELKEQKKVMVRYIVSKARKQKHRLHVVSPSPWPLYSACSAFLFVLGMILYLNYYTGWPLICGFLSLISCFVYWFRDIIREGVYMGYHTEIVQSCLRLGFVLFLVSEVMFFFGFFWALFHYTLTPSIFIGGIWPPQGIVIYLMAEDVNWQSKRDAMIWKAQIPMLCGEKHYTGRTTLVYDRFDFERISRHFDYWPYKMKSPKTLNHDLISSEKYVSLFKCEYNMKKPLYCNSTDLTINFYCRRVLVNPYRIPLLNTALLLTSGFILTLAHSYLRIEYFLAAFRTLNITIAYGIFFILLQGYEYVFSTFAINDGVYGSIFYMLTGFHGFHVIVGTIFLIVCSFRLRASHFTSNNHFAFEAAAWYWHFVDVVWILLYLLLYLWPNAKYFSLNSSIIINPHLDQIVINLNTKYFFRFCNQQPGLRFPAGVNFEYAYPLKTKIMKFILAHYEADIRSYEESHQELLLKIRARKFWALLQYTHW